MDWKAGLILYARINAIHMVCKSNDI